jgi:parvulin-like peptidyl-prolyl isomerase
VKLPDWTREPLVHFLAAGFVLFVALTWSGSGNVDPASRVISVDREVQAQLALQFGRTMGRAPTDAELDAAIDQFVRDEVLYREAIRLGLDQGDGVVRRRLVSKMDLTASTAAEAAEPDEATLRAFYKDNRKRYAEPGAVSFDQLYFASESAASAALPGLGADWKGKGDAISLPPRFDDLAQPEVSSRLGEAFAAALADLKPSEAWQGPLQSGFGWHLVRLRARGSGDPPKFEDIRQQVENDWRSAEIAARKQRAFDVLREAYRVDIDR